MDNDAGLVGDILRYIKLSQILKRKFSKLLGKKLSHC